MNSYYPAFGFLRIFDVWNATLAAYIMYSLQEIQVKWSSCSAFVFALPQVPLHLLRLGHLFSYVGEKLCNHQIFLYFSEKLF